MEGLSGNAVLHGRTTRIRNWGARGTISNAVFLSIAAAAAAAAAPKGVDLPFTFQPRGIDTIISRAIYILFILWPNGFMLDPMKNLH